MRFRGQYYTQFFLLIFIWIEIDLKSSFTFLTIFFHLKMQKRRLIDSQLFTLLFANQGQELGALLKWFGISVVLPRFKKYI